MEKKQIFVKSSFNDYFQTPAHRRTKPVFLESDGRVFSKGWKNHVQKITKIKKAILMAKPLGKSRYRLAASIRNVLESSCIGQATLKSE